MNPDENPTKMEPIWIAYCANKTNRFLVWLRHTFPFLERWLLRDRIVSEGLLMRSIKGRDDVIRIELLSRCVHCLCKFPISFVADIERGTLRVDGELLLDLDLNGADTVTPVAMQTRTHRPGWETERIVSTTIGFETITQGVSRKGLIEVFPDTLYNARLV